MSENVNPKKLDCPNCKELEFKLEEKEKVIKELTATIEQYKQANQVLEVKYQRLYAILGNNIEFALNM